MNENRILPRGRWSGIRLAGMSGMRATELLAMKNGDNALHVDHVIAGNTWWPWTRKMLTEGQEPMAAGQPLCSKVKWIP